MKRSQKRRRQKVKKVVPASPTYSGCIHWAECNLLVDSPMHGTIDIHGAGQFDVYSAIDDYGMQSKVGNVLGVPHCVLSEECARRLDANNVQAIPFSQIKDNPEVRSEFHEVQFKDPFRPWELVKVSK